VWLAADAVGMAAACQVRQAAVAAGVDDSQVADVVGEVRKVGEWQDVVDAGSPA
jgi:hypothetical protein